MNTHCFHGGWNPRAYIHITKRTDNSGGMMRCSGGDSRYPWPCASIVPAPSMDLCFVKAKFLPGG